MKKVLAIIGPTASGKTKFSIEVAKVLDAEIISADSLQCGEVREAWENKNR